MEQIIKRGGSATRYVVPLGNASGELQVVRKSNVVEPGLKQWLLDSKVQNDQIIEQDWWEEIHLQPSEINDRPDELDELGSLRISCVPAQHGSARTGFDKGASLWAGFVVEQFACKPSGAPERTCIYFAG